MSGSVKKYIVHDTPPKWFDLARYLNGDAAVYACYDDCSFLVKEFKGKDAIQKARELIKMLEE
jgi:hypothetical protein